MTLIDKWSKQELEQMAQESTNMSEFARRIGYKSKGCFNTIRNHCDKLNISLSHFTGIAAEATKRTEENIFIENSTATQTTLRNWYKKGEYSPYKCAICGQEPFWNGRELTLTLDHINGINNDDRLENLRWVCPNCDRQLDTFCAKNPNRKTYYNTAKQSFCVDCGKIVAYGTTRCQDCYAKSRRIVDRPDAESLQNILKELKGNFTQVGKLYGVTDNAVRKWCKSYNMPTHSFEYK